MFHFMKDKNITGWSPYRGIVSALKDNKTMECKFNECDPYASPAATTVLSDGSVGSCIRLYHDGMMYHRDNRTIPLRGDILQQTDCNGCQWWRYCKWRNKDKFCEIWKAIFELVHKDLQYYDIEYKFNENEKKSFNDSRFGENHTDGLEHIDGEWRHLDSR